MRKFIVIAVAAVLALATTPSAQQAGALQTAATTLGVANIRTLAFTGAGQNFSVGQNYLASDPWPAVLVKNYQAQINYDSGAMRLELLREMGPGMPRGGGAPFTGEQRQIQFVSGNFAWNVAAPAANAPANAPAPMPAPQPGAQLERMLWLWATPQGFVKAAMANNATTRPNTRGGTDVSFTIGGRHNVTGTINAAGEVERVQTTIDHPVIGDMPVVTTYSGYRNFGTVVFPSRIVQTQDGFPSLDLVIWTATSNPMFDAPVPANVQNAPPPAAQNVTTAMVAPGVHHLTGGGAHSVAIEMRDHIVLVDTPTSIARAEAVIAKAKETIPNKPIRFVVTSHHHWDHLSGIRAAIHEGATIVTHESNRPLLERVARAPHTIIPDPLATSRRPLRIQTVGDRGQLTDGSRVIELHREALNQHTGDMMLVWLPAERVLVEVDIYGPPAMMGQPLAPSAVPFAKALYDTIQRLKLDAQTVVPLHGNRTTTVAEIARGAGVVGTN